MKAETLLIFSVALRKGYIVTSSIVDGRYQVSIEDDERTVTGLAESFDEALRRAAWPLGIGA